MLRAEFGVDASDLTLFGRDIWQSNLWAPTFWHWIVQKKFMFLVYIVEFLVCAHLFLNVFSRKMAILEEMFPKIYKKP